MKRWALALAFCLWAPTAWAQTSTTSLSDRERQKIAEYESIASENELRGSHDTPSLVGALIQMVVALGAVAALAYLLVGKGLPRLLRIPQPTSRRMLEIVDRLPLDQRRTVMVVKLGQEYFLLGATEQNITLLSRLDPEALNTALAAPVAPLPGLAQLFSRAKSKENS